MVYDRNLYVTNAKRKIAGLVQVLEEEYIYISRD